MCTCFENENDIPLRLKTTQKKSQDEIIIVFCFTESERCKEFLFVIRSSEAITGKQYLVSCLSKKEFSRVCLLEN